MECNIYHNPNISHLNIELVHQKKESVTAKTFCQKCFTLSNFLFFNRLTFPCSRKCVLFDICMRLAVNNFIEFDFPIHLDHVNNLTMKYTLVWLSHKNFLIYLLNNYRSTSFNFNFSFFQNESCSIWLKSNWSLHISPISTNHSQTILENEFKIRWK
jgi:hypothetical protein